MIVDHTNIAQEAFEASGLQPTPPYRTTEEALGYITLLLARLPAHELAGYVGKGGDNIAALPDGTTVSVSRICYPDGQIYKVMSDAPNGWAQWVDNGRLPADQQYVPFTGASVPSTDPPPQNNDIADRLTRLEQACQALEEKHILLATRVEDINTNLRGVDAASVKHPLPDYVGSGRVGIFGGSFTVTSKPKPS